MKPRTNGLPRANKTRIFQGEGASWVLIVGGALLSTLSIRLGYKLRQALDTRQQENASNENGKSTERKKLGGSSSRLNSNEYSYTQDEDSYFNCISGNYCEVDDLKHHSNGQMLMETDTPLPLATVPPPEFWVSPPDRLELARKPFHQSNGSDSPCVSESGSDIFNKREVIQKLRQQLKQRDDMILEMQDQVLSLQSSLNSHLSHTSQLQSQLDDTNRDLFDSEREIQRLRKAIADHCVIHLCAAENPPSAPMEGIGMEFSENGRGDDEKIEMLRREVKVLKELLKGKDYLLQSYKEQNTELSMKIIELQQRLDSQLPNILVSRRSKNLPTPEIERIRRCSS